VSPRAQWAAAAVVGVLLAGGAVYAAEQWGKSAPSATPGEPMPNFYAHTMDEPPAPVHFADYRGKVVIVNIWATYCVPCRVEMPSLEKVWREMAPKGLVVVGVSIDDPGFEPQIRAFTKQYGLTFPILQEGTGHIEAMLDAYGVPATFVVGKDGVIRKKVIGATDWASASNVGLVERLLAE